MNYDDIFKTPREVSTMLGWDYYYYDLGDVLLVYKPAEEKISIEPKTFNTKTSDDIPEDILKIFSEYASDPLFEIEKKKILEKHKIDKDKEKEFLLGVIQSLKDII